MAISDDPLDNLINRQSLPSVVLANTSLKDKLAVIASARQFIMDYDLNVVPNFMDDLVSTIFPSYVIDGTYRFEQLDMRQKWQAIIKNGKWNSKQYLHYLLNMYAFGVCGVLTSQQLKDALISTH